MADGFVQAENTPLPLHFSNGSPLKWENSIKLVDGVWCVYINWDFSNIDKNLGKRPEWNSV